MTIRAVLFDIGGPLNTEVEHERRIDADIVAALADEGIAVDDASYAEAVARAVEQYAPDAYGAIIWRLAGCRPDVAGRAQEAVVRRAHGRSAFELRPGIGDVLAWLHGRGLRLGLAANQPAETLAMLDAHGVGRWFHHREVSGVHGFRKPDSRLFLRSCDDLGVQPTECIMVGDRIDNDVAPAKALGMRTVLFRTGRHIGQQPRSVTDLPDREVRDVPALRAALEELLGE